MKKNKYEPEFGMCIRNEDNQVHFQNKEARKLCGEKVGTECLHCNSTESLELGISFHDKKILGNQTVQLAHLANGDSITTFIYSLSEEVEFLKEKLKDCSLTQAEEEVTNYILKGESNSNIRNTLGISEATLKTHINHIYGKAPFLKTWRMRGK